MKNLFKTVFALSFVSLAACGGGGADDAISKMGKLADKVCACKDMKCAEGVMKEMSSIKDPGGKPSKAQMEEAMKVMEKMGECQKKLMAADMPKMPDMPPPAPPAPPAADPAMTPPAGGSAPAMTPPPATP